MDNTKKYLDILVNEIHSTVFATLDDNGMPQTRVIDIMLADDDSIYFLTAKGKEFYHQLMTQKYVAISGMTGGECSLSKKAVSLRGKIRNIGRSHLDDIFEINDYMKQIYPTDESRTALEVFQLYEGQGEFFDLSTKPIVRETFVLGSERAEEHYYYINDKCISCGLCTAKCPQNCITEGLKYEIKTENCLHCGNCMEVCPVNAVERK